jgi:DivIVA domain-containing protein
MRPEDIRSQRFATRLVRGWSPDEVSAFLEDVADAYENLQRANASLAVQVTSLENEIQALSATAMPVAEPPAADREARLRSAQEREDSAVGHIEALRAATLREVEALLHDAQAQAQAVVDAARERDMAMLRDTEALTARMQVEAAELVAGATASAESLISAAKDQESVIRTEIDRLIQSRLRLVEDIRGTLDTYDQWLSTVAPRARAQSGDAFEVSNEGHERADAPDEARVG